jgi:DNA segregation ATPase FtsK/SpoIIIE, S-DNA-T family
VSRRTTTKTPRPAEKNAQTKKRRTSKARSKKKGKETQRQASQGPPKEARSQKAAGSGTGKPPTKRLPPGSGSAPADTGGRDHLRDLWGIGLLAVAGLAGLGLYAGAAGRAGLFLVVVLRSLFGVFGLLAPVAFAAAGILLLREPRPANRRIVAGAALAAVPVTGLWHLARGAPPLGPPSEALFGSGGWVGAAVALPLRAVAAPSGATVILTAMLLTGLVIATGIRLRHVAARLATGLARARQRRVDRRERLRSVSVADGVFDSEAVPDDGFDASGDAFVPPAVGDGDVPATVFDGSDDDTGEIELTDTQLLPASAPAATQPVFGIGGEGATKLAPEDQTWADYELPALDLLRTGRAAAGNKRTLDQMTRALEHTLQQFDVNANVSRVSRGPTVTRFEIELGPGVKVAAVTRLGDDISYALATPEIRIVAPIPGKSAIGIEVPNRDRDLITLGDVLRSPEAAAQTQALSVGIGVDIAGNAVVVNLATMPHLLIAGATGSGKSVTMNSIVTSVLMRVTPADARLILVDPKRVELNHYEGAPHLLTPVVIDPKRATEALAWTLKEMEDRYERLALLGYRNIDAYNAAVRDGGVRRATALSGKADVEWERLPYILVVIDELADLMMVAPRDVEAAIVRIAQMARAVGIHLIAATQRPSVDVVTGLIKANIPSRIALAMATQADSRTILDQGGAEKLVGHGDMLFLPANASKPHRIQGCYVDEGEIARVVGHCKAQREAEYTPGIVRAGQDAAAADALGEDASDDDLVRAAKDLVVRSGLGSTSMLQRKLKIGFARAGRLMDELEQMRVVGPSEGPKARQVLMTVEELEQDDAGPT